MSTSPLSFARGHLRRRCGPSSLGSPVSWALPWAGWSGRHTSNTVLANWGVPRGERGRQLGHSDRSAMTDGTYLPVTDDTHAATRAVWSDVLSWLDEPAESDEEESS